MPRRAAMLLAGGIALSCAHPGSGERCDSNCPAGLSCVHGGPKNIGTCERRCRADRDCPADQYCETLPLPDALAQVCVRGQRAEQMVLVDARSGPDASWVLSGGPLRAGQTYVLVGGEGNHIVVNVEQRDPRDCDDCSADRFVAHPIREFPPGRVLGCNGTKCRPIEATPQTALGPIKQRTFRATTRTHEVELGPSWSSELDVDVDADGRADLERVVRCEHYVPSGCSDRVCDRICRATRTVGATDVRAKSYRSFVPDVDDCAQHAAPKTP